MSIVKKYRERADAVDSLLCIGLDSDFQRLPAAYQQQEAPQFAFNRAIIEQTHTAAAAYKLNAAFYEARGEAGLRDVYRTVRYLQENHPGIVIIYDAKRGDIGSTNEAYARAIFDEMGFDAVTLHPYTGREALAPFLRRADRASIMLCRTSNPGAGEFQDLTCDGRPLWLAIAETIARDWNSAGNCMLVVGATYPAELRQVRAVVGDMPLLVPGIGAQGGDIQAAVQAGCDENGHGLIVSSSRGIIFADDPGAAARDLRNQINRFRRTP